MLLHLLETNRGLKYIFFATSLRRILSGSSCKLIIYVRLVVKPSLHGLFRQDIITCLHVTQVCTDVSISASGTL
jgi:hypothetical protein